MSHVGSLQPRAFYKHLFLLCDLNFFYGKKAFSYAQPTLWKKLPENVRNSQSWNEQEQG